MNSINENSPEALRSEILRLTRLYSNLSHKVSCLTMREKNIRRRKIQYLMQAESLDVRK